LIFTLKYLATKYTQNNFKTLTVPFQRRSFFLNSTPGMLDMAPFSAGLAHTKPQRYPLVHSGVRKVDIPAAV
jgi:hypothetical protein